MPTAGPSGSGEAQLPAWDIMHVEGDYEAEESLGGSEKLRVALPD